MTFFECFFSLPEETPGGTFVFLKMGFSNLWKANRVARFFVRNTARRPTELGSTKTQGTAGLRSSMRTRKRNKKDGAEEPVSEKEEMLSHSDSACRTRQHGVDAVRRRTGVLPTKHHAKMDAGTVKQDYDLTKPGK